MNITVRAKIVWPLTWLMWKWFGVTFYLFKPWWNEKGLKRLVVSPLVFIFIVGDILYNLIVGSFIFWELPNIDPNPLSWHQGEWLFTDRLKHHKSEQSYNSTPESKKLAIQYCKLLGQYDPGHC